MRFDLRGNSRYAVFCGRFRSPLTVYLGDRLYIGIPFRFSMILNDLFKLLSHSIIVRAVRHSSDSFHGRTIHPQCVVIINFCGNDDDCKHCQIPLFQQV